MARSSIVMMFQRIFLVMFTFSAAGFCSMSGGSEEPITYTIRVTNLCVNVYIGGKAHPLCNPTGHHEVKIEFPKGTNVPSAQFDVFPSNVKSCDDRNPKIVPLNSGKLTWFWDDRDNTGMSEVVLQQLGQYSACITYRDRYTLDWMIDTGEKPCFDKNEKATEPKDNPYCLEPLYMDPGWSSQTDNLPALDKGMAATTSAFITPDIVSINELTTSEDRGDWMLESNRAPTFDTLQTLSLNNGGATIPSSFLNLLNANGPNWAPPPVLVDGSGTNSLPAPQTVEFTANQLIDLGRRRISRRRLLGA